MFYAVKSGRETGIFLNWIECEQQVLGYPSAKFRKFETIREAEAYLTPISRSRTVAGSRSSAPVNASSNKRTRWSSPSATTTRFPALNCLTGTAPVLQFAATMSTSSRNEAGVASGIPIDTGTAVRQRPATAVADPITAKNGCYNTDSDGFVHVYTHGICSAKGCRNAKAGIGVYFGDNHPLNQAVPLDGRQTDNSVQIHAAIKAIQLANNHGIDKLHINADSEFLVNGAYHLMPKWKAAGCKWPVGNDPENLDEFRELNQAMNEHQNITVKWQYVVGNVGNERADVLARQGKQLHSKQKMLVRQQEKLQKASKRAE